MEKLESVVVNPWIEVVEDVGEEGEDVGEEGLREGVRMVEEEGRFWVSELLVA